MKKVWSGIVAVASDSLAWKALLVAALIYIALYVATDVLLDKDTAAGAKAAVLALIAATGIGINTIPVRAMKEPSVLDDQDTPRWIQRMRRYRSGFASVVDGVAVAIPATGGWFAAQQWLLSESTDNSYYVLMTLLGMIAHAGLYLSLMSRFHRG